MECPKCLGRGARYEKSPDGRDLYLKHICGYYKLVVSTREEIVIEHFDSTAEIRLPREKSKLRKCLGVVATMEDATSAEIATRLRQMEYEDMDCSVSNVSTMLTILRYKHLVTAVENSKRKDGGSRWKLTAECKALLGVA